MIPHRSLTTSVGLLLLGIFPGFLSAAGELVELSDKAGRTIQAKIIIVAGEEVEIEMADGRRHTLPISRFSLSTQALIKQHGAGGGGAPGHPGAAPENPGAVPGATDPAPPSDFVDDPIFEFLDLDFKEKKLDHFLVRAIGTGFDPADKYAEKVFDVMAETMPALPSLFEKQGFRAPDEEPNSNDFPDPDKRFRHHIYLVEESGDFQNLVNQYAETITNEQSKQNFLQGKTQVGNFSDFEHRLTVIKKTPGNPANQLVAHMVGYQLLGARIEQKNLPFWLRMGAGYYSEHELFKKCVVHYLDFQNYYDSESEAGANAGNMTKAEILSNTVPWPKPLKELCKKNKRVNLERLFAVTTAELTPNDSGYAMALFSYMTSTPELTANFNEMLDGIKEGSIPDPQDMADYFGHATPEEFQEAWYAYIMSSKFR